MVKFVKFTFAIFVLLLLAACGNDANEQKLSLDQAPDDVKSLYQANCIRCHAIDLTGKMGEKTNLQTVYERLTADEIKQMITYGGEMMPSFEERLTGEQIDILAAWLAKQAQ